jgi:hypothetical protein
MKCSDCGEKYSTRGRKDPAAYVFCDKCWEKRSSASVEDIARNVIPNDKLIACGAAYWDTLRSKLGSIFAKGVFGALLGGVGMALTSKEHRYGIIAITERDIIIVDMGCIVGEGLSLDQLRAFSGQPKIKRASLSAVNISAEEIAGLLHVKGNISITAVFPELLEHGNAKKRFAIEKGSRPNGIFTNSGVSKQKTPCPTGDKENSGRKYVGEVKGNKCRICDKMIDESEMAYIVNGELLCVECERKLSESESK